MNSAESRRFTRLGAALTMVLIPGFAALAEAPDLSSPKSAVRSLYQAVDRGDEDAIRQVFHVDDDSQRQLADAFARMIVSTKRLADSAKARFETATDAFALGALAAEDLERLDAAEVKFQGEDQATIQLPLAPRPMQFRRTNGQWRMLITDFAGAAPDRIDAQISLINEIARVASELAGEITAGKHATVQEAESVLQERINEVMTRAARTRPPATRPATQPATQPAPNPPQS